MRMHFHASFLALTFSLLVPISFATPVMGPHHRDMIRHRAQFDSTNGNNLNLARAAPDHARRGSRRRFPNRCSPSTISPPKHIQKVTNTTSTSTSVPSPTDTPTKVQPNEYWPTKTQSGPIYSATMTSSADPYLLSISDALNNDNNPAFHKTYTGDLTYYDTSIVACGDTYTEDTLTAAISHALWDSWPGAVSDTTRNPICGPYTPGRKALNSAGQFYDAVSSSVGYTWIGGDGFPSCDPLVKVQCHIPMTATITNPANGKSVSGVKIVDKCGGCEGEGDIDVTRPLFAKLGSMDDGRISGIQWRFDSY